MRYTTTRPNFQITAATVLAGAMALAVSGSAAAVGSPRFPAGAVWHQDITGATPHVDSGTMISTLMGLCGSPSPGCGFGYGRMQIDFSIYVVHAAAGAPTFTSVELPTAISNPDDRYYSPDCETLGTAMPIPPEARIEGETDLTCDYTNGDCHLIVVQGDNLFEAYRANVSGSTLQTQCVAKWQLNTVYPPEGRGDHCTSADAAGFPIASLLFNADDVAAAIAQPNVADRHLGHAIRFILPNNRMANANSGASVPGRLYVRPATHAGGPSGPTASVPYGSRLRLRANFPMTGYNDAAQVILRTMQKYGIVLADGGNIALTAENDFFTTAKWSTLGISAREFDQTPGATTVAISDFTVLDTGPRIIETYDCVRTVLPTGVIFQNGYE
jgi:hypothetical protein